MTDGTSQGLFIVVAIVIFGIFVVLAYILFEDTLSPAMASMFLEATEQSHEKLADKNLIRKNLLIPHPTNDIHGHATIHSRDMVELYATGDRYTGVRVDSDKFLEPNKNYVLEFTVEKRSGDITHIGGHLDFSTHTEVYLNGDKLDNGQYMADGPFQTGFEVSEDVNHVRVVFNSNNMENDFFVKNPELGYSNPIFIQPNRRYEYVGGVRTLVGFKKEYSAVIKNIRLVEDTE